MIKARWYKNTAISEGYCGLLIKLDEDLQMVLKNSGHINPNALGGLIQESSAGAPARCLDLVPNIIRLVRRDTVPRPATSMEALDALSFLQSTIEAGDRGVMHDLLIKQLTRDLS